MADTRDWFPPFMRAPGDAWNGYYAPQQADPNVLTEEDAFRQNYSRDREVLDALNAGWFGPRGGSLAARTAVDYAPSRLASGAERDVSPKSIFQNTTGIFPDWDAAAPKSGLHRMLSNVFGTPAKREQRRARPAQELFTDPRTGERHQTWPEALVRSASTLAGDVMSGEVAGGVGTLGLRREDYADFMPGGGEREGGIPGVRSLFNPALDAQRGNPAEVMMERAQDLAGVLGGGPLTAPRGTASLASGAKRPPIGDIAMPREFLVPAYKYNGKIYKAKKGELHEDVFGQDVSGDLDYERGFVNHKGQFLVNERATQYALDNGLIHPDFEKWIRKSPGMFTADLLKSDSGKPGAPLAALQNQGVTRRGLFDAFRSKEAEPRALLDIPVEGATLNLPVVQDPLARLMSGAEAPKSNLLDQLTTPPAANVPSANALSAITNVPVDRRSLLRGAGAVAANASRVGRVAEALMKPAEVATAPTAALPKFEEIWKRGDRYTEADLAQAVEDHLEHAFDAFADEKGRNPSEKEYKRIVKEVNEDVRANPDDYMDYNDVTPSGPRYHDYQLPGGDNYRELLIKHPNQLSDVQLKEFFDSHYIGKNKPEWKDLPKERQESWRDTAMRDQERLGGFHSSSWDEPNVLGHLRMHDRDIPGVGRALHLEELNSEWHQEGKQKGYGTKPDPQKVLAQAKEFAHNMHQKGSSEASWASLSDATKQQYLKDAESNLNRSVPDAPLKDNWPDFLLRRAIKEAVESGHDAVSWTPGEHQAARYGLQTELAPKGVMDALKKAQDFEDNLIKKYGHGWEPHATKTEINQLQHLKQEINKVPTPLHDFYDKHLVDRANDIGKQYGAKVEKHNTDLNSNVEIKPSSTIKGVWNVFKDGKEISGDFGAKEAAANYAKKYGYEGANVPVLKITPQLRKAVKDGSFSLLSDSGKPGAPLAALEHAPPFHSAVERALSSAKFDKGSPDQWLGYLRNQPGVRKEELEHLKVDALKGRKSLTRQEMLAHVKDNAPQIKEVWKGGEPEFDPAHAGELAHEIMERDHPNLTPEHSEYFGHFDDAMAQAHEELGFNENGPKFSDANYQLPGGDNYREMLLTMPEQVHPARKALEDFDRDVMDKKYGKRWDAKWGTDKISKEDTKARNKLVQATHNMGPSPSYYSSHWDEPNVLAHARMNDRVIVGPVDAETRALYTRNPGYAKGKPDAGLRSLHLEELQSDWHQTGRKQGYRSQVEPTEAEILQKAKDFINSVPSNTGSGDHWSMMSKENQKIYLDAAREQLKLAGVPDAPFKQTWPDLLLKRLVHEAAAKGYDSVSWTPGAKQAERYDLSKHVDALEVHRIGDSGFQISGKAPGSNSWTTMVKHVTQDKLADHVGKDLADKIKGQNEQVKEYRGLDLKVGGEGMRAFYDKMLVDKANALGKKYGAKVEWQDIATTKQNTDRYLSTVNGRETLLSHSGDRDITDPATIAAWKKAAKPETLKVPVLRLTPKLREAVLKEGFPLFAGALPFGALDEGVKRK